MLKVGTFFFKVTLRAFVFLSYMIVSRNDDKGHCCLSHSRIVRQSTDVSVNSESVVETVCIILVTCTSVCCARVFDVEDTELIVTYVQGNKL